MGWRKFRWLRTTGILLPLALIVLILGLVLDRPGLPVDLGNSSCQPLPVVVDPTDKNLRYVGRYEIDGTSAIFSWPATSIGLRFHGTSLNAKIVLGKNRLEVIVDGKPWKILSSRTKSDHLYNLFTGLPNADHTVILFKRTEAMVGAVSFEGFQLNSGATILPMPAAERRIEVIGDSISAGYGNEATSTKKHFSPRSENAYLTYGAETARTFGADYVCIAWSGKCLWPSNTLPSLYDAILPGDPRSHSWNFEEWKPQAILINLGANDFNEGIPQENGWVQAYHDFIARIRKNSPEAMIYLAMGPMFNDSTPADAQTLSWARRYIQRVVRESNLAGDGKIRFLEFPPQDAQKDGIGADGHPSLTTHQLMAIQWSAVLQADLGWQPITASSNP